MECLERHGLEVFLLFLRETIYYDLLNTTGAKVTVFAPTDDAFAAVQMDLNGIDPNVLIGNHIVDDTIQLDDLQQHKVFLNLQNNLLHSTTVVFYDFSPVYFNPRYHVHNRKKYPSHYNSGYMESRVVSVQ